MDADAQMDADATDALTRVRIAMWLDDYPHENPRSSCAECRKPYKSVDDFIERNPRAGVGFGKSERDDWFVDDVCWSGYAVKLAGRDMR